MPGLALLGVADDESELGDIELWAEEEMEVRICESEQEGGPGPP